MTARPRVVLTAIAVLVVLGGCSVISSSGPPTNAAPVTPLAVPTDEPPGAAMPATEADAGAPPLQSFPGISARRGLDVEALLSAHVEYLSTRSYTVEWARWTVGATGPVAQRFQRRVQVGDDGTYLRRDERSRYGDVTTTYVGTDAAFRRVVGEENTSVTRIHRRGGEPANQRFARLVAFELGAFFSNGYDELDVVERDGRFYARVFTTRPPPQLGEIYDAYTLRNFTATAWVAPDGYVQAVHYEFDLVGFDERLAVEWRYSYSDVGTTTVETPPWLPASAAVEPSTNATAVPDESASPTPDPARVPPPTVANESAAD